MTNIVVQYRNENIVLVQTSAKEEWANEDRSVCVYRTPYRGGTYGWRFTDAFGYPSFGGADTLLEARESLQKSLDEDTRIRSMRPERSPDYRPDRATFNGEHR